MSVTRKIARLLDEFEKQFGRRPTEVVIAPSVRDAILREVAKNRHFPVEPRSPLGFRVDTKVPPGTVYCV